MTIQIPLCFIYLFTLDMIVKITLDRNLTLKQRFCKINKEVHLPFENEDDKELKSFTLFVTESCM